MSLTSVIPAATRASTPTLMLSPRKRRPQNERRDPTASNTVTRESEKPSDEDIYKWTFTREAVAPCFIQDILQMTANESKERDFFWLGRVPCRIVRFVGMVIGVAVYEKKTQYTLDDGTSVVECLFQHPPSTAPVDPMTGYPPSPDPIAHVSQIVRVEGRAAPSRDTRKIYVNTMEVCRSSNDEVAHWNAVLELHRTHYFPAHPIPFIIPSTTLPPTLPPLPVPAVASRSGVPRTPPRPRTTLVDPTYSSSTTYSHAPSSAPASPTRSAAAEPQITKLSHPSRIRPDRLTGLTFRLYLKHYMEHSQSIASVAGSDDSDDETSPPATPTQSRQRAPLPDAEQTPRPKRRLSGSFPTAAPRGFTLAHLRRVPELAILAKRVVKAETTRRAASQASAASRPSREGRAPKMKRLFLSTLVKLHCEGLIVHWDGPVCPLTLGTACAARVGAGLWKEPSAQSQARADASTMSTTSVGTSSLDASSVSQRDEDGALSDPGANEAVYIPVSPAILADAVLRTVEALVAEDRKRRHAVAKGATKGSITTRLRGSDEKWMYLGDWAVEDTLSLLSAQDRIWNVGHGRWEPCL